MATPQLDDTIVFVVGNGFHSKSADKYTRQNSESTSAEPVSIAGRAVDPREIESIRKQNPKDFGDRLFAPIATQEILPPMAIQD